MEAGIEALIKANADTTAKNGKKQTPVQLSKDKAIIAKFNALVKDKGSFVCALIPTYAYVIISIIVIIILTFYFVFLTR